MSSFFQQTAQAMINRHTDRFLLLKINHIIDWQPILLHLHQRKTHQHREQGGRPAYPALSMFKAVLLGQWHNLSDPELEHSLVTRLDFLLFCGVDEMGIPDHST
ncbi:MAG: transposase, partial [Cardiobacteriaceae bacterium]|nr:transposase [Cardiobacteriaceae bacterium]